MTFVPGFNSRFFVGSQRWSLYARSLQAGATIEQLDASSLEDVAQVFANGRITGTASMEMMLDMVGSGQFALATTWQATPQPLTLGFDGCDLADVVWMMLGNQSSCTVMSPLADLVQCNVSVQPDGLVDWGTVIEAETAITTDTTGTTRDQSAGSTNGGVAHLHVTGFSGLTSDAIILEHSTNGSAWSTLGTFATVTGVGSERLVIAPGTTVNRYLRISDDVTGTGTCTRAVAFARR